MKKKSILMAAIAVMLVAVLVVGGTLAYFTDTKSATNTFTVGDVKIKLDESNVNDPDGDRVTSNEVYRHAPRASSIRKTRLSPIPAKTALMCVRS